jgi:aldehyde dehydrogenase (NAD+)
MTANARLPAYLSGGAKKLLIGGERVESSSGETFPTLNPSTGETVAQLASGDARDIDRAVKAARAAFEGPWSRFKPAERQRLLLKLAELVEREAEDLALLDTLEMGRPITDSVRLGAFTARGLRYFSGAGMCIHGRTLLNSYPVEEQSYTLKEPVGVVGAIIPWNGPLFSAAWKIAPALATGCTVVLKPAEDGSLTPLRFAELCLEAGVPPGVVNVVTGFGAAGAALAEHPDVDKISFTGSVETGQKIIRASAGTVKKVTMELGGKSPNIVFADADLQAAAAGSANAVFSNCGQVCSAGTRLFVEQPVYNEFIERVADAGRRLRVGVSTDPTTELGPIVSQRQLERVTSYLRIGVEEGAQIVSGGKRLTDGALAKGNFVAPTVFSKVKDTMRIAQEEIFGPVICALPFESVDEVIARANNTRFGLAAGVWTRDINKAHRAIKRLRAGSVWVNQYQVMDPNVPFGGYKMSGYGREGGLEHLESYLNIKGVWIRTE